MGKFVFDTSEFCLSHGREPRGRGSWAFAFGRQARVEEVIFSPSMTYTEAKRWFRANHKCASEDTVVYVQG